MGHSEENFTIRFGNAADAPGIHALILELATYEKAADQVQLTVDQLREDGFGKDPAYEVLIAEMDGEVVGMALFYPRYSTWKGRTLYLEDLVVKESQRREGIGRALFDELVRIAADRKAARLEWQVLDWNEPAIAFYERWQSAIDGEWLNCRLTQEQLSAYLID